jgi:uncharacterized UPF0160 family protein
MNTTIKKLITHDGSFHADDVFACATLCLILEKNNEQPEIIRTRDEKIIKDGDYVFDVGGIYDKNTNRFDHHQIGGAGRRMVSEGEIAVEYASFGLVWEKFGTALTGENKITEILDKRLAAPIDAFDNGLDLVENKYDITPYYIQHFILSMRPTWREESLSKDEMFLKCVEIAKEILKREIIQAQDAFLAEKMVHTIYKDTKDKRIIVLDKDYPYEYILNNFPEPLFVIYPRSADSFWGVRAVKKTLKTFINRKNFPKLWAGLRDEELVNVTGVPDAIFCHRGLFLAVAKTKEGAIKLAQIAVES